METDVRTKLRGEIMAAGWSELVYQFACGRLLLLDAGADLLEIASAIASDDRACIERSLAERRVWRATDDDARRYAAATSTRFQFVIVQPWVLAQELRPPPG